MVSAQKGISLILATALCGMFATVSSAFSQSWQVTGASNNSWSSLTCSADGTKLVAIAQPYIYASTNSGAIWFRTGAPSNSWTSVASSAKGVKLAATAAVIYNPAGGGAHGGPIYTSTNSGTTWQPTAAPSNQWSSVASSADGSILVATAAYNNSNSAYGLIFISTNFGASWNVTSAPANYWYSVAATAHGTRLIAGATGLFTSTNSGATWKSNNIPWDFQSAVPNWVSVASSADGATLLAIRDLSTYSGGSGPRSYVSTNFGSTWTSNELPHIGRGFVASSADGSHLMASMGHLYLSSDSGTTWAQQTIPGVVYSYAWGCVASSADGEQSFLGLGADDFGRPSTVYTRLSPQKPFLNLAASGLSLALSWIVPSTDLIVQQNSDLTTTNWVKVTNTPALNLTNLQNQVILPATNRSGFYRLATP